MKRNTIEEEAAIPAEMFEKAVSLIVPIAYLHGIKSPAEYQGVKTRSVKKTYSERGSQHLLEKPVFTTFIPKNSGGMLTIFNGHHRTRYAPEYGITSIPTIIFPIEAVAAFTQMPAAILIEKLNQWICESIDKFSRSFARHDKAYSGPQILPEIFSFKQLQSLGVTENQLGIMAFAHCSLVENSGEK